MLFAGYFVAHSSIKYSARNDCQLYEKDFCGMTVYFCLLELQDHCLFEQSLHIPIILPTSCKSTRWSTRYSTIIWLLHHILRNFQDGDHVERNKAKFV